MCHHRLVGTADVAGQILRGERPELRVDAYVCPKSKLERIFLISNGFFCFFKLTISKTIFRKIQNIFANLRKFDNIRYSDGFGFRKHC